MSDDKEEKEKLGRLLALEGLQSVPLSSFKVLEAEIISKMDRIGLIVVDLDFPQNPGYVNEVHQTMQQLWKDYRFTVPVIGLIGPSSEEIYEGTNKNSVICEFVFEANRPKQSAWVN